MAPGVPPLFPACFLLMWSLYEFVISLDSYLPWLLLLLGLGESLHFFSSSSTSGRTPAFDEGGDRYEEGEEI